MEDPTLSQEVETFIEDCLRDPDKGGSVEEKANREQNRKLIKAIVKDIVESRQALSHKHLDGVAKLEDQIPSMLHSFLDEILYLSTCGRRVRVRRSDTTALSHER